MTALLSIRPIPAGDAGALATLYRMRQLVQQALGDPWAVAAARRFVNPETTAPDDVIAAIEEQIGKRFRYQDDPAFVDFLQDPTQQLAQLGTRGMMYGDCDDMAILVAFLGAVYGLPYIFRAVGFEGETGPFEHVFTLLRGSAGWGIIDLTRNPTQPTPVPNRVLDVEG